MDAELLGALLKIVQDKDAATAAHTWRVALYALALAEAAGVPREDHERLMRAAVLHDVGKLDIPRWIVAKPGRLTAEEYEQVKAHTWLGHERLLKMGETDRIVLEVVRSHAVRGFRVLSHCEDLNWRQLMMVYQHHERCGGQGYPVGLPRDEIHPWARLCAVADVFDALTQDRPYHKGELSRDVLEYLDRQAGRVFDEEMVQCWMVMVNNQG